MKLVCKMISTVDYHVFGYEITMYYYTIHWEHCGRYVPIHRIIVESTWSVGVVGAGAPTQIHGRKYTSEFE